MVLRIKQSLLASAFLVSMVHLIAAQNVDVSIRLYNEQVYFPDSPVDLMVTVANDGPEALHFRLADDRRHNVAFDVRDETNVELESTSEFIIAQQSNQQIFYRTVTLQPGEQLSFVERLTDYVAIDTPGLYTVRLTFFPELIQPRSAAGRSSNTINLTVRPGSSPETRREMRFEAVAQEQLRRERLSPDEVVEHMLRARQENNWERFFLYLNLEKLYRQSPSRDRRFIRLSQEEQLQELRTFRMQLRGEEGVVEDSLVVVPDGYRIIETRYTPSDGRVTADLFFNFDTYRERRRYTYVLERRDGFWEVINYQVSNLPNEALPPSSAPGTPGAADTPERDMMQRDTTAPDEAINR